MTTKAPSPIDPAGLPLGWNVQANGNEALTGNSPDSSFSPALTASGLLAESFDINLASGAYLLATAGTLYGSLVQVVESDTLITNLNYVITLAGATLTSGDNFAVLVSQATGAVAGISADQSTLWQTAGAFVTPLVTPIQVSKGNYYVAFVSTGTTKPTFATAAVNSTVIANWNTSSAAGNFNVGIIGTGLTTSGSITAASPYTLAGGTLLGQRLWVGLS